jgi:hypothetical protein
MKLLWLATILLFYFCNGLATVAQEPGPLQTLERNIDNCGCFVYRSSAVNKQNLIFMTDELGEYMTRAWVNLGEGDLELKRISYIENDKGMTFVFEGQGIQVRFKGKITTPASESQEYHILRGKLTVRRGSKKEALVVYVRSGC